jgi:hypothetical protein
VTATIDDTSVEFRVDQRADGYVVRITRDGEPWLIKGPWDDLDVANMMCRAMVEKAEVVAARARATMDKERSR